MDILLGIIRFIFRKNDLIAGIFFILLSYSAFLIPHLTIDKISSLLFGASYYLGVLLVGNFITVKFGGFSVLSRVFHSYKEKKNFLLISIIAGIIFSFVAADLGGLWYFPYWTLTDYVIIGFFLGGWAFYILTLIVCYEAGKVLLDRLLPEKRLVTSYFTYEKYLYPILCFIGIFCLSIVLSNAINQTGYFLNFRYTINEPKLPYLTWPYWMIGFIGTFLICEYIEYKKKRTSLIKDTLHGYFNPLLSILLTGTILSISNEVQNLAVFLWRYANYPLPTTTIFHIPIFIVLSWPYHILALIVFWRAFGSNASDFLFANETKEELAR